MGWAFVRRRMATELGPDWQAKFASVRQGSLVRRLAGPGPSRRRCRGRPRGRGQAAVSRHGVGARGRPEPAEGVFAVGQRFDPAIRTDEIQAEITTRLREELDYRREARHVALYRHMLRDEPNVHVPEAVPALLDRPAADHELAGRASRCSTGRSQSRRKGRAGRQHVPRLVRAVLFLRRDPRRPASRQLHGAARRLGQSDGFRLRARSFRRASCAVRSSFIAR